MRTFNVDITVGSDKGHTSYSCRDFKANDHYECIHIVEEDVKRLVNLSRLRWSGATSYATYEIAETNEPLSEWTYKAVLLGGRHYVYDSVQDLFLFLAEDINNLKKELHKYELSDKRPVQGKSDEGPGTGNADVPGEDVS